MPASIRHTVSFILVSLLSVSLAQANPATLVQDAYVESSGTNMSSVLGTRNVLRVKADASRFNDAYVQFDTSGFGGTVLTATLTFNVTGVRTDGTIDLQVVLGEWNEAVMIFATQPAIDAPIVASIPVSSADNSSTISVDITVVAQAWVDNPFTNFGLKLTSSDADTRLGAKEGGNGATLDLTTDGGAPPPPPPPPGTAAVITSVIVNLDLDLLFISGQNFDNGAAPVVALGDVGVLSLPTPSTATMIEADLPPGLLPGDYLLTVDTGLTPEQMAMYDLTIGAAGTEGPQGVQGKLGPAGADGGDGAQGVQGKLGPAGADGAASTVAGPQGAQGKIGPAGDDGAASTVAGPQGVQGKVGPAGADGADSTVAGPQGAQGKIGPAGADSTVAGPQGVQGKVGPAGADGAAGAVGAQGVQGEIGPAGPPGTEGNAHVGAIYRWNEWSTYVQVWGWMGNNRADLFGGVLPSTWTDSNGVASAMSSDKDVLRTLFNRKGYAGKNALVVADTHNYVSSTNGKMAGVLFRVKNTTGAAIDWNVEAYMTSYAGWGEQASVAVNGISVFASGLTSPLTQLSFTISIPSGQTSTVIFVSSSTQPSGASRSLFLAIVDDSLVLPAGLEYVDDLDIATGGWEQ